MQNEFYYFKRILGQTAHRTINVVQVVNLNIYLYYLDLSPSIKVNFKKRV